MVDQVAGRQREDRHRAVSGLIVIDLDTSEAKDKFKELVPGFDFTTVPRSRTGKGWELFFKYPSVTLPNRARIFPGPDVRGDGGYVVARRQSIRTANITDGRSRSMGTCEKRVQSFTQTPRTRTSLPRNLPKESVPQEISLLVCVLLIRRF